MKVLTSLRLPRLPKRAIDVHKSSAGSVLVVAGSYGLAGAAYFAASGALGAGAGYVRLACPKSIYPILAALLPTVVFVPLESGRDGLVLPGEAAALGDALALSDVVAIGPGLGEGQAAARFFEGLVDIINRPAVFDASALTLASRTGLQARLPRPHVLTPHPGEAARLLGISAADVQADRGAAVEALAGLAGGVAVLKGARTLVCDGSRLYENTSGNAGMATAGAGDVLTGVIAAFAAEGLELFEAACLGVYLHGKAGDLAAGEKGRSFTADDVARAMPEAVMAWEGPGFEAGRRA